MSKYTPFNIVDDYKIKLQEAKTTLGFSPTADVVEVVRCRDCKHSTTYKLWNGRPYIACRYNGLISEVSADHYCSYGERIIDTEEPNVNDNH